MRSPWQALSAEKQVGWSKTFSVDALQSGKCAVRRPDPELQGHREQDALLSPQRLVPPPGPGPSTAPKQSARYKHLQPTRAISFTCISRDETSVQTLPNHWELLPSDAIQPGAQDPLLHQGPEALSPHPAGSPQCMSVYRGHTSPRPEASQDGQEYRTTQGHQARGRGHHHALGRPEAFSSVLTRPCLAGCAGEQHSAQDTPQRSGRSPSR